MKLCVLNRLRGLSGAVYGMAGWAGWVLGVAGAPGDPGASPSPAPPPPMIREEAWGPFYSYQQRESLRQWAVSPWVSHLTDPATDRSETDVLYPLFTHDRFGSEYRLQLLQILSYSGGKSQADTRQDRTTVFPFYFQQRSDDPALNYTAVWPFYGQLQNRLMRDYIRWVMFPLYVQTRKQSTTTDNYLLPLFHVRYGPAVRGWQFWPFYGQEHQDPALKTNTVGFVETVGGHDRYFGLWPVVLHAHTQLGTTNAGTFASVLPFYSRERSPRRDSTTYLWPLITVTDDRQKGYREWDFPWPLVVFARGPGKTANRIWPLFGQVANTNLESEFYLWPLYKVNRAHLDPLERERLRVLFFLYSDLTEKNTAAGTVKRRTDLWPLFTARREADGSQRFQLLSPLEPFLPFNAAIERNYSPLWALWTSHSNAATRTTQQSVLWSLYRRETSPTKSRVSWLFGLVQKETGAGARRWRWRWFFLPLGKGPTAAQP